jgi:hypothetical protein
MIQEYREAYDPELRERNRQKALHEAQQEEWRQEDMRRMAALEAEHRERMRQRRTQYLRPWTPEDIERQASAIEACRETYRRRREAREALAAWTADTESWLTAQMAALPPMLADHRRTMVAAETATRAIDVTRTRTQGRAEQLAVLREHDVDTTGAEPYWPSRQLQSPDVVRLFGAALRLVAALREDRWLESHQWSETMGRL